MCQQSLPKHSLESHEVRGRCDFFYQAQEEGRGPVIKLSPPTPSSLFSPKQAWN